MVSKITQKQEIFCQKYVELGVISEAYKAIYNVSETATKTTYENASKLFALPHIKARIAELKRHHLMRHDVTVDSITQEYEEIRGKAIEDKQYGPAVSAVTGKAKLHGLVTDKSEIGVNLTVKSILAELDGSSTGLPGAEE